MSRSKKALLIGFWGIVVLYLAYAAVFIYKSVIYYNDTPYFGLFDDSLISMQYARNLARGYGLVWMPGDAPVEGFSNPLWVLYMSLFHLLPIPMNVISLPIQITGGVFMVLTLWYVRKITGFLTGEQPLPTLLAVFMTAFYYPITNWSLLGTEVSVLTFIVTVTIWKVITQLHEERFSPWLYVILGVASWIRLDMLLLAGATWLFLVLFDRRNRRQNLIWGAAILAGFTLVQEALRYGYYGDLFPNTYYLKVEGGNLKLTLQRGVYVFVKFVWNFNLLLFLLPFSVLFFRRDKPIWFLFIALYLYIAYSIYVGGDAWEHRGGSNRFISIGMQSFMILFTLTVDYIRQAVQERMGRDPGLRPRLTLVLANGGTIVFALLSLLNFNTLLDTISLKYIFMERPPVLIGTSKTVPLAFFVKDITTENARVLVISAGGIPYFSERYCYDMLGKADKYIAHGPMHMPDGVSLMDWRPGHNKWDYDYSIKQLKPDVITETWWQVPWQQLPDYLKGYTKIQVEELKLFLPQGILYVRTDSPNVRWDLIQKYVVKE